MTCGIYCITNTKSQKRYVGSSVNIEKRWKQHRIDLRGGRHHSRYLQAAWGKYGEGAFRFEIVTTCEREDLIAQEQFWIDAFQAADYKHGYNLAPVADSALGTKRSAETKAKLSASHKGYKPSEETRARLSAASRESQNRPEVRAKRVAALVGQKRSPEAKANMSAARLGWKFSPETLAKMSDAAKGRKASPEARSRMSSVHHELSSGNYKLTDDDVRQIRRLLADGKRQAEIAEMFGVTQTCISHIKLGKNWSHVK